jgi:oligoribonuclease NrnB/cAMP/cGMP phosphodiesterase (DHH superfamily)
MKVLIFTHKNDIDGMGNAILANLAFNEVDYELCGTFDLTSKVESYYENDRIYEYDKVFVTDLCLEDPVLTKIANDEKINNKILDFDHHRTFTAEKYTKHPFINVVIEDEHGLCCGTYLFYNYLVSEGLIDKDNKAIEEFVELTRQHDTWEWRNIYNNEKSRELSILFDALGPTGYINMMISKLKNKDNKTFEYSEIEQLLIDNRKALINEKNEFYSNRIIYKEILGMKAGIVFITYEFRNELAEYFRENKFDMDFTMMIALDPGVVAYRSVKEGIAVRPVAELFGGKGHDKAATNPITEEFMKKFADILTTK